MGISNHLFIVTGSLRGLSLSLIDQLLKPTHSLICIAPSQQASLKFQAHAHGAQLVQWQQDLSDSLQAVRRLTDWLHLQPADRFQSAHLLILNDMLTRTAPVRDLSSADITQCLRTSLETPMAMVSSFLGGTQHWIHRRKVLLMTPLLEAQHTPFFAAQAGLRHFIDLSHAEEARQHNAAQLSLVQYVPPAPEHNEHLSQLSARTLSHLHNAEFGKPPVQSW